MTSPKDQSARRIDVVCRRCESRNSEAERIIEALQERLRMKEEQYETFKQVAREEFNRKQWWEFWK